MKIMSEQYNELLSPYGFEKIDHLVDCSHPWCEVQVEPDEAHWDDESDKAYCSQAHLEADKVWRQVSAEVQQ